MKNDFLKFVKKQMKTDCIRHTKIVKKDVKNSSLWWVRKFFTYNAKQMQADVFITADFKYHEFFNAENELIIADIGHYESEQFTKDLIKDILKEIFPNLPPIYQNSIQTLSTICRYGKETANQRIFSRR